MRSRKQGLTLLEVMIATAVLAVMVGLAFMVHASGMTAADEARTRADLTVRGRMAIDRVRQELQFARIVSIENDIAGPPAYHDHTGVRYQVAMGIVGGVPLYGYRTGDASQAMVAGRSATIRFVADEVVREPNAPAPIVILPAIPAGLKVHRVNYDVNGDGDLDDLFYLGNLVLQFIDASGTVDPSKDTKIAGKLAVRSQPGLAQDLDGDVNGDGVDDPMFIMLDADNNEVPNLAASAATRKVRVTLYHAYLDTRRKKLLISRNQEEIRLENPQ
ncbi:MAG: prepilin-type N-terminal cleavage/methylation domain-containing protein [Planctomycetes bacterium]|nr:prepilin-type N-terminal cleavage/methylation domain-containing protein [Planctomycetota bacterium]